METCRYAPWQNMLLLFKSNRQCSRALYVLTFYLARSTELFWEGVHFFGGLRRKRQSSLLGFCFTSQTVSPFSLKPSLGFYTVMVFCSFVRGILQLAR